MIWGGSLPALIYPGDMVTWKVLAEYNWSPNTTQSGSFFCTAASSTPIRVVTKEIRYIHALSLTLEHSMPISSPAAPGLTRCMWVTAKEKCSHIWKKEYGLTFKVGRRNWSRGLGRKFWLKLLCRQSQPLQWDVLISQRSYVARLVQWLVGIGGVTRRMTRRCTRYGGINWRSQKEKVGSGSEIYIHLTWRCWQNKVGDLYKPQTLVVCKSPGS